MYEAGVQSTPEATRPSRPRQATTLAVPLFGGAAVLQAAIGVVLNVAMLRLLGSDDVMAWCNS